MMRLAVGCLAALMLWGCASDAGTTEDAAQHTPTKTIRYTADLGTVETCTCLAIIAPTVPLALASFMEHWAMPVSSTWTCLIMSNSCQTVYALTIDVAGVRVFSLEMMQKP